MGTGCVHANIWRRLSGEGQRPTARTRRARLPLARIPMSWILPLSRGWAIRFAPPIRLWGWSDGRFAGEGFVGVGIGGHGALQQAVEEQSAVV